jgi:hypothetical protein
VARDPFFRRIRGKDFNPIRYLDPLTSDRGAALARIMQSDKPALEALVSEPARSKRIRDRADRRLRHHPGDQGLTTFIAGILEPEPPQTRLAFRALRERLHISLGFF